MPEDKTTINRMDGTAKLPATNIAGRHQSALRTNAARALQTVMDKNHNTLLSSRYTRVRYTSK